MTIGQLVRIIRRDTWWSEEAPANYNAAIAAWRSFVLQGNIYGRKFLTHCVTLYRNDFCWEKTSEREKLAQFRTILNQWRRQPSRVRRYFRQFRKFRDQCLTERDRVAARLDRLTRVELADHYARVYRPYQRFVSYAVMPEAADIYTDYHLLADLRRALGGRVSEDQISAIALTLATAPFRSFMEEERLAFLRECLKRRPNCQWLSRRFHWVQNNYSGARFLSPAFFAREARRLRREKTEVEIRKEIAGLVRKPTLLTEQQRAAQQRYRLPPRLADTFAFLRFLSRWIDERKAAMIQAAGHIDAILNEVSRRTHVPKTQLGYYTPEELLRFMVVGRRVAASEIRARRKLSAYVTERSGASYQEHIFTGRPAARLFALFSVKKGSRVSGFVASAPAPWGEARQGRPVAKLTGRVQVILNPHREKFTAGRILVTSMTRPDFVPLMRRAVAIITNEGGITSHAAIISRELGIPCIIGTKNATQVFKTGDRVEVDATKGVVRKI